MKLALAALLALALFFLLLGCLGNSNTPPAPDYRPPVAPPVRTVPAPAPSTPSAPSAPAPAAPSRSPASAPRSPASTPSLPSPASNAPAPANPNSSASPTLPPAVSAIAPCLSMTGNAQVDCVFSAARAQKDVTVCTSLSAQEDRNTCITRWCASEARNVGQCAQLTQKDDQQGCLIKCNPNPNT